MSWISSLREAIERRRMMRQLRAMDAGDDQDGYWAFRNLMTEALDVFDRDLRVRARQIWENAYQRFPREAMRSKRSLDLLLKLQLYDEAEALMLAGQKRYPARVQYAKGLVQIAYERGDFDRTLQYAAACRRKYPNDPTAYGLAAAALGRLARPDEAEAMITQGIKAMPQDIYLRIEYAKLAEIRREWPVAMERWAHIRDVHQHVVGCVGVAASLKHQKRYAEAEEALTSVLHKFSAELLVWLQFALISEHKGDLEEAATRWATVRKRFPLQRFGYLDGSRALMKLGDIGAAEDVLRQGIDLIPDDAGLLVEYALLAHRRREFPEAVKRWAVVREIFPKRRDGYEMGAEALAALGQTAEAEALRQNEKPRVEQTA